MLIMELTAAVFLVTLSLFLSVTNAAIGISSSNDTTTTACSPAAPTVFAEWVTLNFTFDEVHTYDSYIAEGKFIPENCAIAGINVDNNGDIYLTVPRWLPGIPATLNKLDIVTKLLTPFPSFDVQDEGEEGDLQNVQSMTIDSKRRMWVIEVGRRNFFAKNPREVVNAAAGIWTIDLVTAEVIDKFYFPEDVVSYDNSFLNDIVLDESRGLAYLSDAMGDGAIVVYDCFQRTSRRYSGVSTQADPNYAMVINGKRK